MIIDSEAALLATRQRVYAAFARADAPVHAHLDITYRCDLRCRHCYLHEKDEWPEMTTAEWLAILPQLREIGVIRLLWSGGEVILRPDLERLLEAAARIGFHSVVKTHAGNLSAEHAAMIRRNGVERVDVSIYSLRPKVHDEVTQLPGSLTRSIAGVRNALNAGVSVKISVSIFPANLDEIEAIDAYFRGLGCDIQFNPKLWPQQNGELISADQHLDPAGVAEAHTRLARLRQQRGEAMSWKTLESDEGACGVGRTSAYITPDGAVWPCVAFPSALGNLRQLTFADIWHGAPLRRELRDYLIRDREDCASCGAAGGCSYCAGHAYTATGDYRRAPEDFHIQTRARMEAHEVVSGERFGAQVWRTVPMPELASSQRQPARKFNFPIYQPRKGRGERVHNLTAISCASGCPD